MTNNAAKQICGSLVLEGTSGRFQMHRRRAELTPCGKKRMAERGFSTVELLVVLAIVIIITGVSIFALRANTRAMSASDAAELITNYCHEAYHRALSQRQTMQVRIDLSNNTVVLVDENLLPTGDEIELRRNQLVTPVSMTRPTASGSPIALPPSPYNYAAATFTSNVWSARFRSDGSVVDAAGNPLSATLFFSPSDLSTFKDVALVRAVTIFGPSGSVRTWRYNGTAFEAGGK